MNLATKIVIGCTATAMIAVLLFEVPKIHVLSVLCIGFCFYTLFNQGEDDDRIY